MFSILEKQTLRFVLDFIAYKHFQEHFVGDFNRVEHIGRNILD